MHERSPLCSEITVPRDNDKNPVVALREIADETLSAANLHEAAVQSYQTQIEVDEPEKKMKYRYPNYR